MLQYNWIFWHLQQALRNDAPSNATIFYLAARFNRDDISLVDEERLKPPKCVTTPEMVGNFMKMRNVTKE